MPQITSSKRIFYSLTVLVRVACASRARRRMRVATRSTGLHISCGTNNPDRISKVLSSCLSETPMLFMDTKSSAAEIRVGFPESTDIESIQKLVAEAIPDDVSVCKISDTAKVTILNVPEKIDSLTNDEAKEKVLNMLQHKNPWLKSEEATVVYIKSHYQNKEKCTVGLRLPIPAQQRLLESGKVYYATSRLNVVERFHLPQCIKCQRYKHQATDCTSSVHVCKLCGEDHDVKQCTNREKKFCINCSTSETHKSNAHLHHSGDRLCPIRLQLIKEQSKN